VVVAFATTVYTLTFLFFGLNYIIIPLSILKSIWGTICAKNSLIQNKDFTSGVYL